MFKNLTPNRDYPEIGGEIHQDRKRKERMAVIIFAFIAIGLLNLILYFMAFYD
jgi:hypothetical protein